MRASLKRLICSGVTLAVRVAFDPQLQVSALLHQLYDLLQDALRIGLNRGLVGIEMNSVDGDVAALVDLIGQAVRRDLLLHRNTGWERGDKK